MNHPFELEPPVALVLCGGNSRGALQVGLYRAISELGIRPDMVVGTSIGALNGAYIAAALPPDALAELWVRFRRADAVSWNPRVVLGQPGVFRLDRLRETLRKTLPAVHFEELSIPLSIATTDLQLGETVFWQGHGDIVEPIVASLSLPGLFPPVAIGARQLVDGGIADNMPLDRAIELGARTVLAIDCICCEPDARPFNSLFEVIARSFSIAIDSKDKADLERFGSRAHLHVVRPRLARDIGLLDFRHTAELMEAGYRQTVAYLTRPASVRQDRGRGAVSAGEIESDAPAAPDI